MSLILVHSFPLLCSLENKGSRCCLSLPEHSEDKDGWYKRDERSGIAGSVHLFEVGKVCGLISNKRQQEESRYHLDTTVWNHNNKQKFMLANNRCPMETKNRVREQYIIRIPTQTKPAFSDNQSLNAAIAFTSYIWTKVCLFLCAQQPKVWDLHSGFTSGSVSLYSMNLHASS